MAKKTEETTAPVACVGQTVLYVLPDGETNAGEQRPAIVTRANDDGSINLHVFRDFTDRGENFPDREIGPFHKERANVNHGQAGGCWLLPYAAPLDLTQ